jgi:hypothetical protein
MLYINTVYIININGFLITYFCILLNTFSRFTKILLCLKFHNKIKMIKIEMLINKKRHINVIINIIHIS